MVVYGRSLTGLRKDSAMVLPGFVLGCHDLEMFWDKFWTRFGHVLANVGDTRTWKMYEKTKALAMVAFCHFSRCL